ncbi:MAG: folylpolyglutamate synthase/dihydrofolate synthase family protein [Ginsengibacter sp.]
MNYEQTLHYLYNKLPLYSSIGIRAYKADLHNTLALCNYLGDPQNKIKTIHIAGTNGKGSTSHMIAAVFQSCGYRTGLYTSPHLKDFRERIKINGDMISRDFVMAFVEKIQTFSEQIQPSFFELTFVMALEYFKYESVDIAVIETGLGGRLDSTNVIMPELSVITNIGFDHMDILGDSLEKIAFEKAGIIKNGVPVVIGEAIPGTKAIFQNKAVESKAPVFFAEERFEVISMDSLEESLQVEVFDNDKKSNGVFTLDLAARYQAKNLITVLTAVDLLKNRFTLEESCIKRALAQVKKLNGLHGRWEVIQKKPKVVLDVAHNVDGVQQLITQINHSTYKKLFIVFGIVKDKEIDSVLGLLPHDALYYFTRAQIARALPEGELLEKATKIHLKGTSCKDVNTALRAAMDKASDEDMIIVCGSVFVVGEVDVTQFKY